MPPDSTRVTSSHNDTTENSTPMQLFQRQKHAFQKDPFPTREVRLENLGKIISAVENNEDKIVEAVSEDFGNRARIETIAAEIVLTISAAKQAKRSLTRWMRARKVKTPLHMKPGHSRVEPQPLGVVGVISPWNYPFQLAMVPAIAAIAAGNRVMIKPSELTPKTSALLADIVAEAFDPAILAAATGGVEIAEVFSSLPFDHLLFTGSTSVGRIVAQAAAKNLTPVTLELGGKSPTIIDDTADLDAAALSIAHGKTFNAGQTCIAPDYVLTPRAALEKTVDAIGEAARKLYPEIDTTDDYTSIVSDRHFDRLKAMVEEAREAGAKIVEIGSSNALHPQRKIPLTLIVDPPKDTKVMQEEIFGPVLPVLSVESFDGAISHVNKGPRPLALYWFGRDTQRRRDVLSQTVSGSVTINDTLWQYAQENLPFGGVGESGIGAYHGDAGFETFSHMKPVFYQSKFASSKTLYPPFTKKTDDMLKLFRKII